ncbi:MAG: UDP-2,3-diacylglucosamine diphosphatase LpxI domain-containing protein, partial [Hyphomicrobiales bacterium]
MRAQTVKSGHRLKPLGVLVKTPQPIQDLRVDMPTIGPATIKGVTDAGLEGIVIAAHRVLVLDPEEVRRMADEAGIFVTAREISGVQASLGN